jgi:hypothetical protein
MEREREIREAMRRLIIRRTAPAGCTFLVSAMCCIVWRVQIVMLFLFSFSLLWCVGILVLSLRKLCI